MNIAKLGSLRSRLQGLQSRLWTTPVRSFCTTEDKTNPVKEYEREMREAKKSIRQKTEAGYKALKVVQDLEYDKSGFHFNRKQSYDDFINRMFEIYNSEKRYKKNYSKNEDINVSLKEILMDEYQPTVRRLERLATARVAKGHTAPAFSDYTTYEIEQSTGMNSAIYDIENGLLPGNFFPPHNIASVLNSFAQLKYKNTDLVPKIRNKMLAVVTNTDERRDSTFNLNETIYGDKEGHANRYHVYQGFKDSKEFYSHVETLLNWRHEDTSIAKAERETKKLTNAEAKQECAEILEIMKGIINSGKEIKSIQREMAEAIETVRSQYSRMAEAFDMNAFLKENPYIKFDLLELQQKMVESGLMHPDEATGKHSVEDLPLHVKMERAFEVFYDLTMDYYPEMAPVTDQIFGSINKSTPRSNANLALVEKQNELNLKYIGLILGKLDEMRHSIRRDPSQINDYFNEKMYPKENVNDPLAKRRDKEIEHMNKCYTRFWDEVTQTYNAMFPRIQQLLFASEQIPLHHLLILNYGMNQGQVIDRELSKQIERKMMESIATHTNIEVNDIIHGLQGLANSCFDWNNLQTICGKLKPQIEDAQIQNLNLNQKLRLAWGMGVLELTDYKVFHKLIQDLNDMPFENAQNELSYEEYQMLRDIYYAVTTSEKEGTPEITNYYLKVLATTSNQILENYPEAAKKFDPFREKLLNGISMCLSKLGSSTLDNAKSLKFQAESEAANVYGMRYPYKPDLLFSHRNNTIALWLVNRSKYETGIGENHNLNGTPYTGTQRFHEKILNRLHPNRNIKCCYVTVEDMVDYDLSKLQAKVNTESLSKLKFLKDDEKNTYIEDLASLSKWFLDTRKSRVNSEGIGMKSLAAEEAFTDLLLEFFEMRQSSHSRLLSTRISNTSNLKAILMKLKLTWDCLTPETKNSINDFTQKLEHSDFHGLLLKIKDMIHEEGQEDTPAIDAQIDKSWMGVRFGIEIPNTHTKSSHEVKDLGVEMLNRNFMWTDDYFHYEDWGKILRNSYDGFNLWVRAPTDLKSDEKYFFQDNWRRVPKGIFPHGKGPRRLSLPNIKEPHKASFLPKLDLIKHRNIGHNVAGHNENKSMIVEDILREREPVTEDVRMITNLQNIKNTLKKTHSDKEILSFITNFEFIDSLIADHLAAYDRAEALQTTKSAKFVPRDARCFREFLKSLDSVKDRYDPYTNFFLNEAGQKEMTHKTLPRLIRKAKTEEEKNYYQEVLDNMLLSKQSHEKSDLNVGTHVIKKKDIHYNFESLIRDENNYDRDERVYSDEFSDENFLLKQRREAESNLIKTKILHKLHEDRPLTSNEKAYLKRWNEELKSGKYLSVRDCMVPNDHSQKTLGALSSSDKQHLHSLALVDTSGLDAYALNDVVLELNHFLDTKTIQTVQKEVLVENLKNEWDLPKDYMLSERRNKEIDLVMGEIEETAYRHAGKFEPHELEGMKRMYKTKRGEGIFDKAWLDIDMKEFENFEFNNFDDRFDLLEKWFDKKEKEIRTRIYLPNEELKESFFYASKVQAKTRELMGKVFNKEYSSITSDDLNEFVNALSSRLMLFDGEFPSFLPYLIKETVNHPNITPIDKDQLEAYSDMFEIRWREDIDQPLMLSPVYCKDSRVANDDLEEENISEKMRKAGIPYLENLKEKILSHH